MSSHSLTADQIERVRATWALVAPAADFLARRFYAHLFALDPDLRRLFARTDFPEQRRKLMQTLAVIVAGLNDLTRLLPATRALGRRHRGYGATDAHYATVGDALLGALGDALGAEFDDGARAAWARVYQTIADVMRAAAADEAPVMGHTAEQPTATVLA